MGLDRKNAKGAVRLSLGRSTTGDEVIKAAEKLGEAWKELTGC
jgi:cysteine sulfinate desulfinase/cysteine desulfurase-like protein